MRIGLFHNAPYYLRYYRTALTALADDGHHLVLARPDRYPEAVVPVALRKRKRVTAVTYPWVRSDDLDAAVGIVRAARDFTRYEEPALRSAYASRNRAFERVLRSVAGKTRSLAYEGEAPDLDLTDDQLIELERMFAAVERLIPADPGLLGFVRRQRLDVAVSISRVNIAARETEVIKAAKHLGVPSAMIVYSWDNLSGKGLIHEHPDRVFVWNGIQADEAERLHGIPRSRIVATGAVRFDSVFRTTPSGDRSGLLDDLGLDPDRATVLYLGSSGFVAPREPEFVDRYVEALRKSGDERLRTANVIVRPHPGTVKDAVWANWSPELPEIVRPEDVIKGRAQDLYDQIFASDAVVALNTSAEIEAAIVGRPVLTVQAGSLAPGQEGSVHFRYLLAEHGGFVETATSLDDHLRQLLRAVEDDPLAPARRRFLETFVRPMGLDVEVGPLLAEAIEELGRARAGRSRPRLRRVIARA